jgi:hypothetical protein
MRQRSATPASAIRAGEGCLALAQRNAGRPHAVALGGAEHQAAPPAADVQQALTGPQPELAAQEIQLRLLGGMDVLLPCLEVRARVHHSPVQPHRVELVAHVVVGADRSPISFSGVEPAPQVTRSPAAILLGHIVCRKPSQPAREAREKGRRAQTCKEHISQLRGLLEVSFHVEVVAKVGFAQREILGRQEHPPERPRPPQHQGEAGLVTRLFFRTIPEP